MSSLYMKSEDMAAILGKVKKHNSRAAKAQ